MRKYRAWDKLTNKMRVVEKISWMYKDKKPRFSLLDTHMSGVCYTLERDEDDIILMEDTDLKDKNGKKVWESDLVRYHDICSDDWILNQEKAEKTLGQINWIEYRCQFMPQEIRENHKGGHYTSHWDFITGLEVIGNIHENKNLLEIR